MIFFKKITNFIKITQNYYLFIITNKKHVTNIYKN